MQADKIKVFLDSCSGFVSFVLNKSGAGLYFKRLF
jgi:hypothetical protein